MKKTIVEQFQMQLDEKPEPLWVPANWRWTPRDPYRVSILFNLPNGILEWMMGRELLAQGLSAPSGVGDVQLKPLGQWLIMDLRSPDGHARFAIHRAAAADFLDRTYSQVPYGKESLMINWKKELEDLMV